MAIRAHHREEERLAEQLRARAQGPSAAESPSLSSGESPSSSDSPSEGADGPLGLLSEAEAEALMAKSMGQS